MSRDGETRGIKVDARPRGRQGDEAEMRDGKVRGRKKGKRR